MKAPIKKLQNKFRYQILMRVKTPAFKFTVQEVCAGYKMRGVFVSVEVNPQNLT